MAQGFYSAFDTQIAPKQPPMAPALPMGTGGTPVSFDDVRAQLAGTGQNNLGTPLAPISRDFQNYFQPVQRARDPNIQSMNPINRQFSGGGTFNQGQNILAPAYNGAINPGTQQILDLLQQKGDYTRSRGISEAQALAARRGLSGSTVEQFGTQEAGRQADQVTIDAQNQALMQGLNLSSQARSQAAAGYMDRGNQQQSLGGQFSLQEFQSEAQRRQTMAQLTSQNDLAYMSESDKQNALRASLEQNAATTQFTTQADRDKAAAQIAYQKGIAGAQLTSDELASIRNYQFGQQNLALQQQLGQQGIDVARQNIEASKDIANKQAQYGLLGSLGAAAIPAIMGGYGTGGGVLSRLFNGGGAGGLGAAAGGLSGVMSAQPYNPGFAVGSTQFPGGVGAVGTGVAGGGAISPWLGVPAIAGAGIGSMALSGAAGNLAQNATGSSTLSNAASAVASPVGAQLNKVRDIFSGGNVIQNIGSSVSSVFGGSGKTADGNAIAEVSRGLDSNLENLRGLKQALASGQLTEEQYNAQAMPIVMASKQAVEGMASKGSTYATAVNAKWKALLDEGFARAQGSTWMLGNTNTALA